MFLQFSSFQRSSDFCSQFPFSGLFAFEDSFGYSPVSIQQKGNGKMHWIIFIFSPWSRFQLFSWTKTLWFSCWIFTQHQRNVQLAWAEWIARDNFSFRPWLLFTHFQLFHVQTLWWYPRKAVGISREFQLVSQTLITHFKLSSRPKTPWR